MWISCSVLEDSVRDAEYFGRFKSIHVIPKWPPFKYSFVYLQISPFYLVLKLEIQKNIFP